ncbi:branched-chain amino acid transport system II carrier protein [Mobiluncus mulieris]|uniref:branched-chain amino acid transport system II carrier protein n=1 Tax=Mobiluncus mulieris TaxID=2052 RepID=UPI001470276C|nr:branched-chain amino acid transport system II carrier protein [Mobiluncus mulieris]NMW81205.1 branched-chain amino acid transport system II carrier protein [Mobiluncus mulieris]
MSKSVKPVKGFDSYLLVSGFALFAMFFGAGNLIFPFQVGITSGAQVIPAVSGILLTGVLFPVAGMLAASTDSHGAGRIADRIGHVPGLVLTVAIFLFCGICYAMPRVAVVSWEMAVKPLTGLGSDSGSASQVGLFVYSVVFFALTLFLCNRPDKMLDRIGQYLTPALLVLLVAMIAIAMFRLPSVPTLHLDPAYAKAPLATGLKTGYGTMDALASLMFGVVIITQLHNRGYNEKRTVFRATAFTAGIAGVSLGLVYTGLAFLGTRIADQKVDNPAAGLSMAAEMVFGPVGKVLFSIIVFLACLTTAVGLMGASLQYFKALLPKVPSKAMVGVHVVVSLMVANLGLENILAFVVTIGLATYPPAICLIVVTLVDYAMSRKQLYWAYRLSAWVAGVVGFLEAVSTFALPAWGGKVTDFQEAMQGVLKMLPLGDIQMGWLTPAMVVMVVGLVLDVVAPVDPSKLPHSQTPTGIPDRESTTDELVLAES